MIASNANVLKSFGLEHCTLVHFRHAFSECIEDPIEKVKCGTVGIESLWLNQLADKHRLQLDEWYPLLGTEKQSSLCADNKEKEMLHLTTFNYKRDDFKG